ncbi:MAG: hypothetical protein ACKO18_00690 [Bacteroidota bacterium]
MKKWITSFLAMILVALSLQQSHAQSITLGQVTGLVGDRGFVPGAHGYPALRYGIVELGSCYPCPCRGW